MITRLITPADFENLSDYVIPKDELCSKLLTVDFKQYYVISMAILLRHDKSSKIYLREKYIFSVALVIEKTAYYPKVISEALRKLAFAFTHIENTTHHIYNHNMDEIRPLL